MSQEAKERIDLHLHSTASDGGLPPEEVVGYYAGLEYSVIALTDHDTVDGCSAAIAAGEENGVRVVAGCEFSVGAPWGEMHLLGYFLPIDSQELIDFLVEQQQMRLKRAQEIVRRLDGLGLKVDVDAVMVEAMGGAIGRPHVARVLVARGFVADIDAAFKYYLGPRQPAYVPKTLPQLNDVTKLVRKIGGVSSAAHLRTRATRSTLKTIADAGVDAVEVIHPAHPPDMIRKISALSSECGLLKSGGSDWHGIRPECGQENSFAIPEVPYDWLESLEGLHEERISSE